VLRRPVIQSPRATLAALATGAALAASVTGLVVLTDAEAAATASSAYGIAASGVDDVGRQPSVSSDGAVKTASAGSVSGSAGTFTASGLTVKAGAGVAEASVSSLTVGGRSIGSVTAKCADGKTTVTHSGSAVNEANLHVSFGGGGGSSATGATITIIGADGEAAETITVAGVSCTAGAPPATTAPPTSTTTRPEQPAGAPTSGNPTGHPASTPGTPPTTTRAPAPTPVPGHLSVTG